MSLPIPTPLLQNELNHLLIMESLGGDQLWWDRFVGEHAAVFYYWILVGEGEGRGCSVSLLSGSLIIANRKIAS